MMRRTLLTLGIVIALMTAVYAQPGDPTDFDPDDDGEAIPLGRTEILFIAGGILGIWKILNSRTLLVSAINSNGKKIIKTPVQIQTKEKEMCV